MWILEVFVDDEETFMGKEWWVSRGHVEGSKRNSRCLFQLKPYLVAVQFNVVHPRPQVVSNKDGNATAVFFSWDDGAAQAIIPCNAERGRAFDFGKGDNIISMYKFAINWVLKFGWYATNVHAENSYLTCPVS